MTIRAGDLCETAYEHLGLADIEAEEAIDAAQLSKMLPRLDRMLKSDFANGSWRALRERVAISHRGDTIEIKKGGLVKTDPYKVIRVIRLHGNAKVPLQRLSEAEYDQLPISRGGSTPLSFFEMRMADNSVQVKVWPTTTQTQPLEVVVQKRLADVTGVDDEIELPDEWEEALGYRLALRSRNLFGVPLNAIQDVTLAAGELWKELERIGIESTHVDLV